MVRWRRHLRLRQLLGRLFLVSGLVVSATAVAGYLSFQNMSDERRALLSRIDPANLLVSQLLASYLDEETAVRGYALSQQGIFLQPYLSGQDQIASTDKQLTALLPPGSPTGRLLATFHQRATRWQSSFAVPSVAAINAHNYKFDDTAELNRGKTLFDGVRRSFTALQHELRVERTGAQNRLASATDLLATFMIVALVVILLNGVTIWIALRRIVLRPVAEVAEDARLVASGNLEHEVRPTGPKEVVDLAGDIEAMRVRIFSEMSSSQEARDQLAELNEELSRSNEDLEQFAYVASHDLQEPLRKVASFCQLLEQRYGDQLDERGEQYIAFAVDGAKRMQVLINDLLAFSRIGRSTESFQEVALADCVEMAKRNLAGAIEASEGQVDVDGPLPVVMGDRGLLAALMQNLIGNALKFHGDEPPLVTVSARVEDEQWIVSVEDNGIGIESRFAERIFVIFQRLHGRDAYSGTGIGLAMCRKIVEFHGGRIWLDTEHTPGTRFYFSLPQITSQESHDELDTSVPAH